MLKSVIQLRPLFALLAISGCTSSPGGTITAAGATFPAAIYQKWFEEFYRQRPDAKINYQSVGSGAGIEQLTIPTVDFGASDVPMTDAQLASIKRCRILHFPTVLGGLVPVYNIPGVEAEINFTGETLAGIFLGRIHKWNDPALKEINPDLNLPDSSIVVVHRSDGSGTSFVWTDFLAKSSPEWKARVGTSTSVNWPVGLGAKGNEGVAGLVKQTPDSLGYVELIYATATKMSYGRVRNRAGMFVKADFDSVSQAAAGVVDNMPADFRVSITDAPGDHAYPISTFTWLLIPDRIENPAKRKTLQDFLHWMITTGQKDATGLGYAPLPDAVAGKVAKQIALIH